jgi:hypothetical protein
MKKTKKLKQPESVADFKARIAAMKPYTHNETREAQDDKLLVRGPSDSGYHPPKRKTTKYYIYEETTYETEADSPREAMLKFQRDLKYPEGFSVEVHERNVVDEKQNDVTEEAETDPANI